MFSLCIFYVFINDIPFSFVKEKKKRKEKRETILVKRLIIEILNIVLTLLRRGHYEVKKH